MVENEQNSYGGFSAESYEKADAKLFIGICTGQYPTDAVLIELVPDNEAEEVSENDILSIEYLA